MWSEGKLSKLAALWISKPVQMKLDKHSVTVIHQREGFFLTKHLNTLLSLFTLRHGIWTLEVRDQASIACSVSNLKNLLCRLEELHTFKATFAKLSHYDEIPNSRL